MADYFVSSTTGALLRRDSGRDTAWYGTPPAWHPTHTIGEYMVGREDNVDSVTEEQARSSHPAAFAGSKRR
jgi:hypothetical protein